MFKLTIECKDLKELTSVVGKLGDSAMRGTVQAESKTGTSEPAKTESSSKSVTKKDLLEKAESMGLDVNSRNTKVEIEKAIEEAETGAPAAPVQPAQVPPQSVPQMQAPAQQPAPAAPQAPAQQTQAPAAPAQVAVDTNALLTSIQERLAMLAQRGVPDDQLAPMVQQACQQAGAPVNVRLSQMEPHHLAAAHPFIISALDQALGQGQSPSAFV